MKYIKYIAGMMLFLSFVACNSSDVMSDAELEEMMGAEQFLIEFYGEVSLKKAIRYDLFSYVSKEVEKQGTANILVNGDWALNAACSSGSKRVVRLLLSSGADPSLRGPWGCLPIQDAWSEYRWLSKANAEEDDIGACKEIMQMLEIPAKNYKPRSFEAEESAAIECVTQFFIRSYGRPSVGSRHYLEFNGKDASLSMLEALTRTYGYSVYPASQNPNEKSKGEVRVNIEWVSEKEANYNVSENYFFRSGIVTYAYGHWLLEELNSGELN